MIRGLTLRMKKDSLMFSDRISVKKHAVSQLYWEGGGLQLFSAGIGDM